MDASDDMNGASLSMMFNISEGFLRCRNKEALQFLPYYAASGRNYIPDHEARELIELNESIARMLRRWQSRLEGG